jgi:methylated-DNA-[protein]-cysteine S-methyltransferase
MVGAMERVYYAGLRVPDGLLWIAASEQGLLQTLESKKGLFDMVRRKLSADFILDYGRFKRVQDWLAGFYSGKFEKYEGSFDLRGTEFQKKVWKAVHEIPYGRLSSYGLIARKIGTPRAARAVGNAVGANPLGPLIPCHRVVWSNGGIGGFGGGLEKKRRLLHLEGILPSWKETAERGVDLRKFFE